MTQITILSAVLLAAVLAGAALRFRAGKVRRITPPTRIGSERTELLTEAGIGSTVAIVHFSADWCGPCAAVRRVIAQVIGEQPQADTTPLEIELDIDENQLLAKELGVLSLPTTFIFDDTATERFRIAGVPSAADLRSALGTLATP